MLLLKDVMFMRLTCGDSGNLGAAMAEKQCPNGHELYIKIRITLTICAKFAATERVTKLAEIPDSFTARNSNMMKIREKLNGKKDTKTLRRSLMGTESTGPSKTPSADMISTGFPP